MQKNRKLEYDKCPSNIDYLTMAEAMLSGLLVLEEYAGDSLPADRVARKIREAYKACITEINGCRQDF